MERDGSSSASCSQSDPYDVPHSTSRNREHKSTGLHCSNCDHVVPRRQDWAIMALLGLLLCVPSLHAAELVLPSRAERSAAMRASIASTSFGHLRGDPSSDVTTSAAGALLVASGTSMTAASAHDPATSAQHAASVLDQSMPGAELNSSPSSVFEDAMVQTFPDMTRSMSTTAQYADLLKWLGTSAARASVYNSRIRSADGRSISPANYNASGPLYNIPELKDFAVREIMYDAMQVAAAPQNETTLLLVLDYIRSRLVRQVSQRSGFPITRRVIVGALIKRRLEDGPFSPAVQEVVQRILLQLFSLHKSSAVVKGHVQFFHISKSGGTNLCQTAQANGCQAQGFDLRANCLVKAFGDTPRWVSYQAHKYIQYSLHAQKTTPWFANFHTRRRNNFNCAARRAMLQQNGWDFYANEFTAPVGSGGTQRHVPAQLCGEFVNMLLFREPTSRLRSQIVWIQKLYQAYYMQMDTSPAFTNKTAAYWNRLAPAAVDNYYIRSLLGQRHFEYPMTRLGEVDLHNAQLTTMQHDLLFALEDRLAADVTLRVGLGWTQVMQDQAIRSSETFANGNTPPTHGGAGTAAAAAGGAASHAVNSVQTPMPVDYDALVAANALDARLYKFALAMQDLDLFLFRSVALLDQRLGLNNLSTRKCGYVSLGKAGTQ